MKPKTKSRVTFFTLLATTLLTLLSGFVSFAWFINRAEADSKSDGSTVAAYFAYGKGTEESPFGINSPRHLYNLAWLQYIGKFEDKTYYFELDPNMSSALDMSGFTALPPIGTTEYPFIGQFNGNGKTIKDLTVSNDFSDYTYKPSRITSTSIGEEVNIIGLFGVVGQYNSNPSDAIYKSSASAVKNFAIESLTVKSSSSQTLIGLACGYDNGTLSGVGINNSSIKAKEGASPITSITSNLSDYSLVGYATEKALSKVNVRDDTAKTPVVVNPNTSQGGTNWNSSVDMQTMFTNLSKVRDSTGISNGSSTSDIYYNTSETVTIHGDGTIETTVTGKDNINTRTTYDYYYGYKYIRYQGYTDTTTVADKNGNSTNYSEASFTFAREYTDSSMTEVSSSEDNFVCLYGAETMTTDQTDAITTNTYSPVYGITITSNGQTFTYNNNTKFYLDAGKLYTVINGTKYFLNASGSNYSFSPTASTTNWSYDGSFLSYASSSTSYALYYSTTSGRWTLGFGTPTSTPTVWKYGNPMPTKFYIYDSSQKRYLNYSNTYTPSSTTNISSATTWGYDGTGYYPTSNSNVHRGYFNSSYQVIIYDSQNAYYSIDSSNRLSAYVSSNGRTYYIRFSSNRWSASSSRADTFQLQYYDYTYNSSYATTITTDKSDVRDSEAYTTSKSTQSATYKTNATYFPLTWETNSDGTTSPDPSPADTNTGYVVSGSHIKDSSSSGSTTYQKLFGDIRVSRFEMSDLSVATNSSVSTYTSSTSLDVVTYDATQSNGWTLIEDSKNSGTTPSSDLTDAFGSTKRNYRSELHLSRYRKSRQGLENVLLNQSYVYGLHFMDAQISKDHLVTIGHAKVVDGKTKTTDDSGKAVDTYTDYYNYQMPEDSIDFNLKSMGYINFFAGTYFTNNDTFFSLHKIDRNSDNTISSIKEISKIYQPTDEKEAAADNPYVYVYSGESDNYSSNSSYKLVFDMSKVTNPKIVENALYYFEIPVNSGEYALGSVSGKTGSYLIYLDIGAGTANYQAVTTHEKVDTKITSAVYPIGVDFVNSTKDNTSLTAEAKGGQSASVSVSSASSSEVNMTYQYSKASNSRGVLTCSSSPGSVIYEASDVDVKVGSTNVDYAGKYTTPYTLNREISENYNVWTETVTKTYTDTYTFTGAKSGDTFHLQTPTATSGYTIGATEWNTSDSSIATVSNGIVTFVKDGAVNITLTWNESIGDQSEWKTAPSDNEVAYDEDTGSWTSDASNILHFHFEDPTKAAVVGYVYSYDSTTKIFTYTIQVTSTEATSLIIDSFPTDATHRVIITDGTNSYTITNTTTETTYAIAATTNS